MFEFIEDRKFFFKYRGKRRSTAKYREEKNRFFDYLLDQMDVVKKTVVQGL